MDTEKKGYNNSCHLSPTKRYCQTLDLVNDPQLIAEYEKFHSKEYYWPEVGEGIRRVGILNMEIYRFGTRLFMIVETAIDFEWDSAFQKLAELPRQSEWEEFVSVFQNGASSATATEKWKLMKRIFSLP